MLRAIVTVCLVLLAIPAAATTLEQLTLDEMIAKANVIVRARVLGAGSRARGPMIYTHWKLQTIETLKGSAAGASEAVTPGGSSGGLQQRFAGVPKLIEGSEYVLFLWTSKSGLNHIIGLSQGVLNIRAAVNGTTAATRNAIADPMVDSAGRPVQDAGLTIDLSALRERIRRVAAMEK